MATLYVGAAPARRASLTTLLVLVLSASLSSAASAATSFSIDVSSPSVPLRFPMLESTGSGHAALALRADYRRDLASASRDIGFKHVRGHGILDDDTSAYLNGAANMFNVFSIFDYFMSIGMKPIVELSFMPSELAANPSLTIMHYKGITSPPKN
jgi:xylan 1,4-beta-xylosidase